MKTAFSLLLQEYVNPVELDYKDCRTFQIVCPACKEPVFKVSRKIADTRTDYFSHYRKDETLNKQCELRVNRISTKRIDEVRSESRNQKLRLFLKVFQDIIWENEYNEITTKKSKSIINRMGEYKMISPYTHQDADLFIMFGSRLSYNAFGILLRIPYLQILQKQLKDRETEHSNHWSNAEELMLIGSSQSISRIMLR